MGVRAITKAYPMNSRKFHRGKVGTTNEFTTNASGLNTGCHAFDGATSSIQRGLINQFNAGSVPQYAVYNTFSSTAPYTLEIGMYNLFNNASSSEKIANVGIFWHFSHTGDHTGASYYFDGSSSSTKKGSMQISQIRQWGPSMDWMC